MVNSMINGKWVLNEGPVNSLCNISKIIETRRRAGACYSMLVLPSVYTQTSVVISFDYFILRLLWDIHTVLCVVLFYVLYCFMCCTVLCVLLFCVLYCFVCCTCPSQRSILVSIIFITLDDASTFFPLSLWTRFVDSWHPVQWQPVSGYTAGI